MKVETLSRGRVEVDALSLLDHGYLKPVVIYGDEEGIVEAARMSTGKGFLGWGPKDDGTPGDEKLLKFLYSNHHDTPFEMAGAIFEVQAPIFVFREWHRHRTQSYNEMSARYTPLPDVNYVPSIDRLMMNANGANKQAGTVAGAPALTEKDAEEFREVLAAHYQVAEAEYQWYLSIGVPKELARIGLPVGRYSRMRAAANLRNWLAFMTLRAAPNAQYEIRVYAHAMAAFLDQYFPLTMGFFRERFGIA